MSEIDRIAESAYYLAIGADMLQDLVCRLGTGDGELDEEGYGRTFYLALKLAHDAKALRELAEGAPVQDAPYLAKIRTAATDTGLIDHVLATFRLADASFGDDNPGVRASVLKAALDAWIAKRKTPAAA